MATEPRVDRRPLPASPESDDRHASAPEQLLQRLDWHVIRRLDGLLQGDHRGLFHGVGIDFADLRDYQPSDDVRHIDWNVTARMATPFVRQYVEDREVTAWFLLDRSASMSFGPPTRDKHDVVAELVTSLARLLTRQGNRVGAVMWSHRVDGIIRPASGRRQVLRIAQALLERSAPDGSATRLDDLLEAGQRTLRRRSVAFVISDFISEPGWERRLGALADRNDVVPIRIVDPRELDLPDAGVLMLQDAETGEQLRVDTGDPAFRARYRAAAAERERRVAEAAAKARVELFEVSTSDDLVAALVRMAELRRRMRR